MGIGSEAKADDEVVDGYSGDGSAIKVFREVAKPDEWKDCQDGRAKEKEIFCTTLKQNNAGYEIHGIGKNHNAAQGEKQNAK